MAYFEDLTRYSYSSCGDIRSFEVNVGWLDKGHPFPTADPSGELLQSLWRYCEIRVCPMRGFHSCAFCSGNCGGPDCYGGEYRLLGSAEVRVFAPSGAVYAAPNLIYHYVAVHHYSPPEDFVKALSTVPAPPAEEYLQALRSLGREWTSRKVIDLAQANRFAQFPHRRPLA